MQIIPLFDMSAFVIVHVSFSGESVAAISAFIWFLTGMSSNVMPQTGSLSEGFATPLVVACIF